MLISNTPDFAGAAWEPFATNRVWTLAGNTTVYVRFRDKAGNVSSVISTQARLYLPFVRRQVAVGSDGKPDLRNVPAPRPPFSLSAQSRQVPRPHRSGAGPGTAWLYNL